MERPRPSIAALALTAVAFLCAGPADGWGGQDQPQAREEVARLFAAADAAFDRGDLATALENYFEVTTVSLDRAELARASLGLAICYFSLNDRDRATSWIAQTLEYDPDKEPIDRIYPESFVLLFMEVREARSRPAEPRPPELRPETPPPAPPVQEPKTTPPTKPRAGIRLLGGADWKDKWEIEAHISSWSLNPVKALFESYVTDNLAEEIRDQVLDRVRESFPLLVQTGHEESLAFDSDGSNYGFGVRFYPKGRKSGFSLELSFEKTHLKLMVAGPVQQAYTSGGASQVDSNAYIETSPFATNLSFRWELIPPWRVTPYIVCGLGIAVLGGEVGTDWRGTFQYQNQQTVIEDNVVKTFIEAEEESDFNIPNIFVLLHLGLGVKAELIPGLSGIVEAGIWDGIMFRAGIAYRFNF